jgi:CO/xanthine dehydrogenase Mo-binding subunit
MSYDESPGDVVRQDALDKVTGRARYTSDMSMQGMAYTALVRSQVSHGVIRSVDTAAAKRAPGVLAIVTGADLGALGIVEPYFGLVILDQPVLTSDVVRFFGEPIAAVVAESTVAAEHAASLVSAEIEALEGVFDPESALRSDTRIHGNRQSADPDWANVAARFEYTGGDVDAALAGAHYVHRETYRFPTVAHVAMEPHCCIAAWDTGNDTLEVISSTQQVFKVRADLARIFGLPLAAVRVRAPYVGGGFGGKLLSKYEPLAAALSRAAGRPVRVMLSPEEQFLTIGRHAAVVTRYADPAGHRGLRGQGPGGREEGGLPGQGAVRDPPLPLGRHGDLHQQGSGRSVPRIFHPAGGLGRGERGQRDRCAPRRRPGRIPAAAARPPRRDVHAR